MSAYLLGSLIGGCAAAIVAIVLLVITRPNSSGAE